MSIFKSKATMTPRRAEGRRGDFIGAGIPTRDRPCVVRTTMTPDEARAEKMANYPRFDWGDVRNIRRD